jgi:orotate phosphoribosyltransferase
MSALQHDFLAFSVQQNVLRFGEFTTKAGRLSPYFFNAGLFQDGNSLRTLCQFYAQTILASGVVFDMLFGPAYKGIPLVAGIAIALAERGHNVPFAYNRKEVKDHGEGGTLVGAPLQGKVLIVDDVISAGTSVRESVLLIRAAGANAAGVAIALDRQEKGSGQKSAVQEVQTQYQMPVVSIANLHSLLAYLQAEETLMQHLAAVESYRRQYGVI